MCIMKNLFMAGIGDFRLMMRLAYAKRALGWSLYHLGLPREYIVSRVIVHGVLESCIADTAVLDTNLLRLSSHPRQPLRR